mmetsp:Transcript_10727/g.38100  ORF Transcript_10727/g.38100 Transcript_10727/m.38100 type:complete len:388 (-) Transcript_10727:339-1502(-)
MASWSLSRFSCRLFLCLVMKSSLRQFCSCRNSAWFKYLKHRSSSSALMDHTPSLFARGTKTCMVSSAILFCFSGVSAFKVLMLCSLSASLISTTLTSAMLRSMFLNLSELSWPVDPEEEMDSAPMASLLICDMCDMRLTPTTMSTTSSGMYSRSCCSVIMVSSRTSCRRPAATVCSSNPSLARISAVSTTWLRYASPFLRSWPVCAHLPSSNASFTRGEPKTSCLSPSSFEMRVSCAMATSSFLVENPVQSTGLSTTPTFVSASDSDSRAMVSREGLLGSELKLEAFAFALVVARTVALWKATWSLPLVEYERGSALKGLVSSFGGANPLTTFCFCLFVSYEPVTGLTGATRPLNFLECVSEPTLHCSSLSLMLLGVCAEVPPCELP